MNTTLCYRVYFTVSHYRNPYEPTSIGVPPNHPWIDEWFSIIFTINFGVPLFLETPKWSNGKKNIGWS